MSIVNPPRAQERSPALLRSPGRPDARRRSGRPRFRATRRKRREEDRWPELPSFPREPRTVGVPGRKPNPCPYSATATAPPGSPDRSSTKQQAPKRNRFHALYQYRLTAPESMGLGSVLHRPLKHSTCVYPAEGPEDQAEVPAAVAGMGGRRLVGPGGRGRSMVRHSDLNPLVSEGNGLSLLKERDRRYGGRHH